MSEACRHAGSLADRGDGIIRGLPIALDTAAREPDRIPATSAIVRPSAPAGRRIAAVLLGLIAGGLLLFNTAWARAGMDFKQREGERRLWDDLAVGVTRYLEAAFPTEPGAALLEPADTREVYHGLINRRIRQEDVRPWEFWRTLSPKPFLRHRSPLAVPEVSDPGRALVLATGLRLLGGISPFLILWLGAFVTVPVLLWISWEFFEAGHALAGAGFLLLITCSPFVVETLSLPRSAVGFYLTGLLLLVPLAVHAVLGRSASPALFFVRGLAAGILFAICCLCRAGCLFLIPGFLLALWLGAGRVSRVAALSGRWPVRWPMRLAPFLAAVALLLTPYGLVKQPQHHDAWQAIWEGLGDFDRSKGHAWSDAKALELIVSLGGRRLRDPPSEELLRGVVIQHIREDPLWYADILLKRFLATLGQTKLWPWRPRDGVSMAPSDSPNEGTMDKYYRYTTTVDFIGFPGARAELPVLVLIAPTALLIVLRAVVRRAPALAGARDRLSALLTVLLCVALAALPVPVLISTAGGQDTQAFVFVYFLGFAFLLEEAARWGGSRL